MKTSFTAEVVSTSPQFSSFPESIKPDVYGNLSFRQILLLGKKQKSDLGYLYHSSGSATEA